MGMGKNGESKWLSIGLGIICLFMGVALIGAYSGDKDTRLKDVPHITNNNYHVTPNVAADLIPAPHRSTPTSLTVPVAYTRHEPTPQTVMIQASPDPVPEQRIIYVEKPRPEPAPDTTIVVYKPEVRQPVHKVVVIDERYERLKAEHEARMREWTSGPVVVVK